MAKLLIPKEVVTYTSKRSCYRTLFGYHRIYVFQTLLKLGQQHYYPVFPWVRDILSWKKSALVWSDILRLLVSTLTADNKRSRCNMQNFGQQVQTASSQKEKTFSGFLLHFWNMHKIWNILKQKMSILA